MKRILLLILVLTLSLSMLIGCQAVDKVKDLVGIGGGEQSGEETPEEGENNKPDDDKKEDVVDYLPDAVRFLHNLYKEKNEMTARDFDVIGQVMIDGVVFPVTWTCDNERIAIRTSVSNPKNYTVDLPTVNEEEFSYTLTATVSDDKGNSEQRSYTFKVPVLAGIETDLEEGVAYKISFNQVKLGKRLFALSSTQNGQNKFILATNDPKLAPDFYVEKVGDGYKFYTEVDGVKTYVYAKTEDNDGKISKFIGFSTEEGSVFYYDTIGAWHTTVNGLQYGFGTYNEFDTLCISDWSFFTASSVGSSQFVAEFITSEYAETLSPEETPEIEEPADGSTLTIPQANELGLKVIGSSKGKFYVTGKVVEIKNTTYGNLYIADENGNKFYIYGCYDATGANRFDAMANQPKVGDTITVYGALGNYNNEAQMKNAWVTSIVPGSGEVDPHEHTFVDGKCQCGATDPNYTPDTPAFGVVTPVAGVAYKFGMVQAKAGKTVYLKGGMSGYYMATTENVDEAIDVYLEETTDGYYLYTLNADGSKLYINMVVSGTHVNGAYEAAASTVYTVDAARQSIVATVNDELYHFGTRNDNTYLTVGPCKVSYEGFDCQFYGATSGSDTPDDPNPEVPHEHTFVEGKCECGATDPNYTPDTPVAGVPEIGKGHTISANNANGPLYFDGTVTGGRFNGSADASKAAIVYIENGANAGEYLLYFFIGDAKNYIVMADNSSGGSFTTSAASATAFEWNADKNTFAVAEDSNNRAFGCGATSTYTNFSAYDLTGNYNWGQFTPVDGTDTPVDPNPEVPHEHTFVEGKCECGETDPNYQPPTVDPETPAFGVVTPVAGVAYKFGMVQAKAGKTVYLKGGMSGYYMATTENVDEAIDVYLEETTGGYYLYTLNADGSKLYINMVVSGTHVNGAYEAAASTVYTYDAARKSIVATVNDALYHFGTRNDNTYLTVGPCKVSYEGFDCQFYGATSGSDTPVDPNPEVPHEHTFVEGKCECGETDPNYQPPTVDPETPVVGGGSANFDSIELPSSKPNGDSSYTGKYSTGDGWSIENSAIQCGGANNVNPQFTVIGSDNTSKAPCLNGKVGAAGKLTSSTLTGGISKLTLNYTKMFTDTKLSVTVTVTDLATGTAYTHVISVELPKDEKYVVYTDVWTLDAPISGDFTIEIVNNCPSQNTGNKDRITILDLIWE